MADQFSVANRDGEYATIIDDYAAIVEQHEAKPMSREKAEQLLVLVEAMDPEGWEIVPFVEVA